MPSHRLLTNELKEIDLVTTCFPQLKDFERLTERVLSAEKRGK